MAAIPPALLGWLKGQYPTLTIRQTWLTECVTYLRENMGALTDAQLIKATNEQLLLADLTDIAERPCLPADIANMEKGTLGTGQRGAVLVQIVGIRDIGVSALSQLDVCEARKAAKSTLGGAALSFPSSSTANAITPSSQLLAPHQTESTQQREGMDHMTEFEQQEEARRPSTVFPRSMLRVELSDGHTVTPVPAFEQKRIQQLVLGETPLGYKLLLKGAEIRRGQILLRPEHVVLKGGMVEEMQQSADELLINTLRQKLGKAPLEPIASSETLPVQASAPAPSPESAPAPAPARPTTSVVQRASPSTAGIPAGPTAPAPPPPRTNSGLLAALDHMSGPEPDIDTDPDVRRQVSSDRVGPNNHNHTQNQNRAGSGPSRAHPSVAMSPNPNPKSGPPRAGLRIPAPAVAVAADLDEGLEMDHDEIMDFDEAELLYESFLADEEEVFRELHSHSHSHGAAAPGQAQPQPQPQARSGEPPNRNRSAERTGKRVASALQGANTDDQEPSTSSPVPASATAARPLRRLKRGAPPAHSSQEDEVAGAGRAGRRNIKTSSSASASKNRDESEPIIISSSPEP